MSDVKPNQQKIHILQEIPSNIRLQIEDKSTETRKPHDDTNKSAESTGKSCKNDVKASTQTVSTNRHSGGERDINKHTCTCSCNHHRKSDDYLKR